MRHLVAVATAGFCVVAAPANARLVYQRPASHEIVAAHDDGTHPHVIARGRGPVVSPDGTKVAFISGRSPYATALRVVSAAGGKSRRLARKVTGGTPPDSIAWSPGSRYVTMGRLARAEVTVDVSTGHRRVVELGDLSSQRTFSPDSESLLVEVVHPSDSDIAAIQGPHGRVHTLAGGEGPAWGADGFAYRDAQRGIVFLRGLDAAPERIHRRGDAVPRDWAADGDVLLAEGGQHPDRVRALLIDRHTRHTRFLRQRFSALERISRNGRAVLGERGGNVVAAWRDGSVKVLARNATTPSWTK